MRAFVTGGTGFIGRRLVSTLAARGHSVSVLTRIHRNDFPQDINLVVGDLGVERSISEPALTPFDVIFHCAGEIKNTSLMRGLHVIGTRRLVDSARRAAQSRGKPIHWVQLSSVGAYGAPQGRANAERVVTESTPERPLGEYEVTKTESDRLVVEMANPEELTYSILRPSNVFGPGMPNASLRALIRVVRKGLFFYIGPPGAISTYVHVDDVVEALLACGTNLCAHGRVYNLSSDCPVEELIRGIASAAGVRSPIIRLPEYVVRAIVGIFPGHVPLPLTNEQINALVSRTRYPTTKIERELGIPSPRYVPDAIAALVGERR